MGMFDTVTFDEPHAPFGVAEWQTKNLGSTLANYRITPELELQRQWTTSDGEQQWTQTGITTDFAIRAHDSSGGYRCLTVTANAGVVESITEDPDRANNLAYINVDYLPSRDRYTAQAGGYELTVTAPSAAEAITHLADCMKRTLPEGDSDGPLRLVCTGCGHDHTSIDRVPVPDDDDDALDDALVCPECYTNACLPYSLVVPAADGSDEEADADVDVDAEGEADTAESES